MNYVLIENGQITDGPKNLPKNWKNITRFDLMAPTDLLTFKWYPVEYVEKSYDSSTHNHAGYDLDIQSTKVVLTSKHDAFTRYQLEVNVVNDYQSNWFKLDREMDRDEEDHVTWYHAGKPNTSPRGIRRSQAEIYNERITKRENPPAEPVLPLPGEPDYYGERP